MSGNNSSGWNRPASNQPAVKKGGAKAPSMMRGIIAGLVIVCALGALCVWLFSGGEDAPKDKVSKDRGRIKEVTPAAASKYVEKEAPKKVEKPIWERPMPSGLDEDSQAAWKRKMAYEKKRATDERLKRFLEKMETPKSTFKTGTEQVLDWIFTTRVGDVPPPPLPPVPLFELNHIDEILDSVNEIGKDDNEETIARKKIVDEVKKELKEYVKSGGNVEDFMKHYRDELVEAWHQKSMVASEINRVIKEGDSEIAVPFIERANKILEDKGIEPVQLSEDQKDALAEGFNNGKENNDEVK